MPLLPIHSEIEHLCYTIRQLPGLSHARREYNSFSSASMLLIYQTLFDTVRYWTNAEGNVSYKKNLERNWRFWIQKVHRINHSQKFIIKKMKMSQLWKKEHGRPLFNLIMSRQRFKQILQILHFYNVSATRRHKSVDNLQPIRKMFENRFSTYEMLLFQEHTWL